MTLDEAIRDFLVRIEDNSLYGSILREIRRQNRVAAIRARMKRNLARRRALAQRLSGRRNRGI